LALANELKAYFDYACTTRGDYLKLKTVYACPPNLCWQHSCVQRQAAAVRMFLRFFRLTVFAFEIPDALFHYAREFVDFSEFATARSEFTLTIAEFAPLSPCGIACAANWETTPFLKTRQ
jgi:hypothetical protein